MDNTISNIKPVVNQNISTSASTAQNPATTSEIKDGDKKLSKTLIALGAIGAAAISIGIFMLKKKKPVDTDILTKPSGAGQFSEEEMKPIEKEVQIRTAKENEIIRAREIQDFIIETKYTLPQRTAEELEAYKKDYENLLNRKEAMELIQETNRRLEKGEVDKSIAQKTMGIVTANQSNADKLIEKNKQDKLIKEAVDAVDKTRTKEIAQQRARQSSDINRQNRQNRTQGTNKIIKYIKSRPIYDTACSFMKDMKEAVEMFKQL